MKYGMMSTGLAFHRTTVERGILETADKATKHDPKTMQTGPAMRGDQNILKMRGQLLAGADRKDLQNIYVLLSEGIFKRHQING